LLGLGPLETLLHDDDITDILVNGHSQVYVEKFGKLHHTDVTFQDDQHLMLIIDRIVSQVGRRVDESSPMVDARLRDGSRINAIIPPLALDGPALSIRRFGKKRYDIEALVDKGTLSREVVDFLRAVVRARLNIIVCGGTGSGKTTMLNCLSGFIPEDERIVTIEDSAELSLQQPHVVRLETRPANLDRKGEISQRDLVKNCLRMRPDRIIVGEVRSTEVYDMLQAMFDRPRRLDRHHPCQQPARIHRAARDDDAARWLLDSATRHASADRLRHQHYRSRQPALRRYPQIDEDFRDQRHGRRDHHDAGSLRVYPH
jgi:pilus assembly protein CpaF